MAGRLSVMLAPLTGVGKAFLRLGRAARSVIARKAALRPAPGAVAEPADYSGGRSPGRRPEIDMRLSTCQRPRVLLVYEHPWRLQHLPNLQTARQRRSRR